MNYMKKQKSLFLGKRAGSQRGIPGRRPSPQKRDRKNRNAKKVLEFLDGFEGCVLQSDGYSGYDSAVDF